MRKITYFKTMLVAIALIVGSRSASAQSLYEGFNYTVGTNMGGNTTATLEGPNNNWYTHSNSKVGTIDVTSGSLTYTGLASSVGNKVRLPGDNTNVPRDVNTAITGTGANIVYFSVLVNVADATQLNTTGDYFMSLGGATGAVTNTSLGGRLYIKSVNTAANYRLMITNNSSGTVTQTEFATDLNFGSTYLVVVKYDKGVTPNTASLWVNPSSLGSSEPTGSVSNSSGTGVMTTFASICLRNSSGTPKADIDEIRVGTTWASVTPIDNTTSINQATTASTIYTSNGNVVLTEIAGRSVEIYNSIGQRLISTKTLEGVNTIPVSTRGVVLVKVDNRITRVIL